MKKINKLLFIIVLLSNLKTAYSSVNKLIPPLKKELSCPFTASIIATGNGNVCVGSCIDLNSTINNGCSNYTYLWSHGLPSTAGPHQVCPLVTTIYTLVVTDINDVSNTFTTTKTIVVNSASINPLPLSVTSTGTVCQSAIPFVLTANPSNGKWYGSGITTVSPDNTQTGIFTPDSAGVGVFYIKFKSNKSCVDSIKIVVTEMDAGFNDAACTGALPFTVSGGLPLGGAWSGSTYINSTGSFTPSTQGTYTINYTHPNGCSENKTINVDNLIVPLTVTSICQSINDISFQYSVSPLGGRFSGVGITNTVSGAFNPNVSGGGLHAITYQLGSGCSATFSVFVKDINVQNTMYACPFQLAFDVPAATPIGGYWATTGPSITNSITGTYNPSILGTFDREELLIYHAPNGCFDTLAVTCINTNILKDTLYFCDDSSPMLLDNSTVKTFPSGGIFTGNGVNFQPGGYYFYPTMTGVGVHTVFYEQSTCKDSIIMIVYPAQLPNLDKTVCTAEAPYVIAELPPGALWNGPGVDAASGIFNPAAAGTGTFDIYYTTPSGCSDTVEIIVYQYQLALITGLSNTYCYKDTNIVFSATPDGGTLTAFGVNGYTLNPKDAANSTFLIKYEHGEGMCYTADSVEVTVYDQIQTTINVSKDSLCAGAGSNIIIHVSGGDIGGIFSYQWDNTILPLNSNIVNPSTTTTYTIITSDGCSPPKQDTVRIFVYPPFVASLSSPTLCYGVVGSASVSASPAASYSYVWNTSPTQTATSITNAVSGEAYGISITNKTTGCLLDTFFQIPSFAPIKALFSADPNLTCIPFEDKLVTFSDLCNGADSGSWSFAGTIIPYIKNTPTPFDFVNSGTHQVNLTVYNNGKCSDTHSMQICILEIAEIFIPDIFSPNGDGQNDVLFIRGKGIKEVKLILYDRWGEKVFETNDQNTGWDGTYKGVPADVASYIYYAEITMIDDKKVSKKGSISLIK